MFMSSPTRWVGQSAHDLRVDEAVWFHKSSHLPHCTKNAIKRGLRAANCIVSLADLTFKLLMSRDLIADG
jgi:hypothetical protein